MSADNRICIMKDYNEQYAVWEGSLSVNYYEPPFTAERFNTEKKAIEYAILLTKDCCVLEGGIERISNTEQLKGLTEEIEHLSGRIKLLITSNKQWETNYLI